MATELSWIRIRMVLLCEMADGSEMKTFAGVKTKYFGGGQNHGKFKFRNDKQTALADT